MKRENGRAAHSGFAIPEPIIPLLIGLIMAPAFCFPQGHEALNTAKNCGYMKPEEREMVYEINLLRSDPAGYVQYVQYYYDLAKLNLDHYGKGKRNYTLSTHYESINGTERLKRIDTTWSNEYEEEYHATESLIRDLKKTPPMSILKPDKGIYEASRKHALDQDRHNWSLGHRGSDGSWPWDRIRKYSPGMKDGNENLAGRFPEGSAREIVIQLLIDSGIPDYGHRYNLLDPKWTHVACYTSGLKAEMYQWVQDFGQIAK
ncbi:MAG: hypothetical protein NTU98_01455 [Bacteroidetes bacterium]|nr:hypothetical protein [Bacteroidota bacterium]